MYDAFLVVTQLYQNVLFKFKKSSFLPEHLRAHSHKEREKDCKLVITMAKLRMALASTHGARENAHEGVPAKKMIF